MVHQRIPYTGAREKIGTAADCIDACHQKITPQLRRKTMQWLRRRSEPCELRGALFLAAWLLSERNRQGPHAFYLAAAFQIRTKWIGALFTYVRHSVLPRHSYDLASYMRQPDIGNVRKPGFLRAPPWPPAMRHLLVRSERDPGPASPRPTSMEAQYGSPGLTRCSPAPWVPELRLYLYRWYGESLTPRVLR
jgi:hypothetical protein